MLNRSAGIVEAHWQKRQCRIEDAICFPNDEVIELCGSPSTGYRAEVRAPISSFLHSNADHWAECVEECSTKVNEYHISAGGTRYEGDGFIAVSRGANGPLVWILHVSDSEIFTELAYADGIIHAVSEEYPFRAEWHIPLHSPEDLSVTQERVK